MCLLCMDGHMCVWMCVCGCVTWMCVCVMNVCVCDECVCMDLRIFVCASVCSVYVL